MELSLSNKLKIVVGQQMQLSLRVLQMSNLQLEEYMRSLFEENPLLAEKAPAERPPRSLSAAENSFRQSGARYNLEDTEFLQAGLHSESFRDYVLAQINMTKMPQKQSLMLPKQAQPDLAALSLSSTAADGFGNILSR